MKPEFTIEHIREFNNKGYRSVSARIVNSLLIHYSELEKENNRIKQVHHGELYEKIAELKRQLAEQEEIKEGMQLTIDSLIANNDNSIQSSNHNSPQPTEQVLYRWVKCSERMPDDIGSKYFLKTAKTKNSRRVNVEG